MVKKWKKRDSIFGFGVWSSFLWEVGTWIYELNNFNVMAKSLFEKFRL